MAIPLLSRLRRRSAGAKPARRRQPSARGRLREKLPPVLLGLTLTLAALSFADSNAALPNIIRSRIDYLIYDLRLSLAPAPATQDDRIVIIDVDEKSLAAEGQWPWRRDKIAHLLEALWRAGVAVTAFDMQFSEPEANVVDLIGKRAPRELADLAPLREKFDNDRLLAETIRKVATDDPAQPPPMNVVLGYVFRRDAAPPIGVLPEPALRPEPGLLARLRFFADHGSYSASLGVLQQAAGAAGFFNTDPDSDGVYRRASLLTLHKGALYPSLALETARVYYAIDGYRPELFSIDWADYRGDLAPERVHLGDRVIPVDTNGFVTVPFRGPQGSFPYISATDVLQGRVDPIRLEGRIALVGATAPGLFDLRPTPVQRVYPGVEVHANILAGILDNHLPAHPSWEGPVMLIAVALLGLIAALLFPQLSPLALIATLTLSVGGLLGFGYWAWTRHFFVVSLAAPILTVVVIGLANLAYGFLIENRRKEQLTSRFGEYVPPELVAEMSESGERYGFEGESRELTVLFCDIRGFTTLSEKLDAHHLKALLNRFFTPMTRVIFEHRGTIDKYVGDMIMAFWGAPIADPDHRRHGIEAALGMIKEVARLRAQFEAEGLPPVDVGIGLNSGVMNVGDMGSEYRRAYTVIGDAVNLGSRLEGLTKFYGVNLVVSETTRQGLESAFVFRTLDLVKVKGKAQAVAVYEPICALHEATDELLDEVEAGEFAFALYRDAQWDDAEQAYRRLARAHPQRKLYRLFLERIDALRAAPPPADWDGSYSRTEK